MITQYVIKSLPEKGEATDEVNMNVFRLRIVSDEIYETINKLI